MSPPGFCGADYLSEDDIPIHSGNDDNAEYSPSTHERPVRSKRVSAPEAKGKHG
jgi:hypothetical protein